MPCSAPAVRLGNRREAPYSADPVQCADREAGRPAHPAGHRHRDPDQDQRGGARAAARTPRSRWGRKLQDILRALPESADITLSLDDKRLTVKAGRSRFQLQTLPAADYPRLTAPEDQGVTIRVPQKVFKHQLAQVAYSMAQQDIRYYLNGLLMMVAGNALRMVATDGHRLAFAEASSKASTRRPRSSCRARR